MNMTAAAVRMAMVVAVMAMVGIGRCMAVVVIMR